MLGDSLRGAACRLSKFKQQVSGTHLNNGKRLIVANNLPVSKAQN